VAREPVMRHFDYGKEAFIECDSSDTVTAGVLSQKDENGQLRPVAYFSTSLGPVERNYAIYDKELLAIIRCFKEWRPKLQSASESQPTQVLTDHKSLEYFMSTKKLSRRQARWAEFLSQYNFKVTYRPGAANGKADALTRREDSDVSRAKEDPNLNQTVLTRSMLSDEVIRDLNINVLEQEQIEVTATLADVIASANRLNTLFRELRTSKRSKGKLEGWSLASCENVQGLLMYKGKLTIPHNIRRQVIQEIHNSLEVGHSGLKKTYVAVRSSYRWPTDYEDTKQYINNCHDYRRAKPRHEAPAGLLTPLPIPDRP